jgi:hypothetical protein
LSAVKKNEKNKFENRDENENKAKRIEQIGGGMNWSCLERI